MAFKRIEKITYPSITEWIKKISMPNSELFINEDETKYDRLKVLKEIIKLPYLPPIEMRAEDILNKTKYFKRIFNKKRNNLCTLRLLPLLAGLSKIRKRGGSLAENIKWYLKQNINHRDYKIEIVPRNNQVLWSAIFVVDYHGIIGEINNSGITSMVKGDHRQAPIIFSYNFKNWKLSKINPRVEKILKSAIKKICVKSYQKRNILKNKLNAEFTIGNFIRGYFEFTIWPKTGIRFIDYNRFQNNIQKERDIWGKNYDNKIAGVCVSTGKTTGCVRIIKDPAKDKFEKNDILVCKNIDISFLPIILSSSGIITEKGAMLSHAAIICRELKKPYIALVKNATKKIKNGQKITLDANLGQIILD